jgi:hypothetical protein
MTTISGTSRTWKGEEEEEGGGKKKRFYHTDQTIINAL